MKGGTSLSMKPMDYKLTYKRHQSTLNISWQRQSVLPAVSSSGAACDTGSVRCTLTP